MVAPARPSRAVRGGEQRFDLVAGQVADQPLVATLDWDRHDPRHLAQRVRHTERDQAEERPDGSEPVVARPYGAAAVTLEVVEEGQYGVGIQSRKRECCGFGARPVPHEAQQQAEGVAVAGDGLRTGALVGEQVLGEERLQMRADKATRHGRRCPHGSPPITPPGAKRAPAARSSSGVAVRYQ